MKKSRFSTYLIVILIPILSLINTNQLMMVSKRIMICMSFLKRIKMG